MSTESYVLLALAGRTPQVITETAWAIALETRALRIPARAVVLTTTVGEAFARAHLLGEEVRHPFTGVPIDSAAPRWFRMFEALGAANAPPLDIIVPRANGSPLHDISGAAEDEAFASRCFQTVASLTEGDAETVVGSIAGGARR